VIRDKFRDRLSSVGDDDRFAIGGPPDELIQPRPERCDADLEHGVYIYQITVVSASTADYRVHVVGWYP
jgi:hypothetical protein